MTIQEVFNRVHSPSGLPFPETVKALRELNVTRYFVDFAACTITCYISSPAAAGPERGQVEVIRTPSFADHKGFPGEWPIWDGSGVVAAIRFAQRGEGNYHEFAALMIKAGVVGYHAFLTGQRVLYFGSEGDFHVEWFPGAGPRK